MTLLRHFSPADYVTITNGAIGVLGILYFIDGGETHILTGTALILIALLMDGLDGAIARKFGSKHNIGVYLDSMSDSVSFCFAPAVFIYKMFYDIDRGSALENTDNFLAVAASISIATFGIVRLSLFSYFKEDKLETFLGLPTPSMALFVLTGGILFQNYAWFLLPATIAIGGLMLLNFPYPKIRGRLVGISLIGVLAGLVGALMGIWDHPYYTAPLGLSFALILLYIASPIYYRKRDIGIQGTMDRQRKDGT